MLRFTTAIHGSASGANSMPLAPLKPCRHPMCREFASNRGYCTTHQPMVSEARTRYDQTTRKDDPALAWAKQQRNSSRWQATRSQYRSINPCCCDPFKRHGEYPPLGTVINHVVPLRVCFESGRHELAYEWTNLSTLCSSCDADIGAMERKGQDTKPLFDQCKQEVQSIGFA